MLKDYWKLRKVSKCFKQLQAIVLLVLCEKSTYTKFKEIIDSADGTERLFNEFRESLPLEYHGYFDAIKEPILNLDRRNVQIHVNRVNRELPWYVRGICCSGLRGAPFYTYLELGLIFLASLLIVWRIFLTAFS